MTHLLCKTTVLVFALVAGMTLTSCFKDEPLNAECDIERVAVTVDDPESFFFQLTDTAQNISSTDSVIVFSVRSHADITALAPRLTLTPGATVVPANGSVQDFSNGPVRYTVTSEDGNWQRRYKISFVPTTVLVSDTMKIDFEYYELEPVNQSYYVWYEMTESGTLEPNWATGNGGFKISKSTAQPFDYPTVPEVNGLDGSCLHLITRDTGAFGQMAKKPIAAGNFFYGEFDITVALRTPLKATRFGRPFTRRPVRYTGYYKYKSGSVFKDKDGKVIDGRKDYGSIYAVFYKNHDANGNEVMLFGDDVLTNPNIVGIARVPDMHETNEWTAFDVYFNYTEEIDNTVLDNRGYSLAIVFSSSVDGDLFQGAIGSEMYVDKVRLISTRDE